MYHRSHLGVIPFMAFYLVLVIIISGCSLSGCSKKDAEYLSSKTIFPLSIPITLAWDPPKTYTDGLNLDPASDLQEYRIYFSTQPGVYSSDNYYTVTAPATSITITEITSVPAGTYYFVVTAVDKSNGESGFSNEVSRELR